MSFILSFLSGIIAAFTPCIIILFPILLYRFSTQKDGITKDFLLFISSFILSYLIFGYLLSSLFSSPIQNGLKFGLGLLFIILGVLGIFNKLNPLNFPLIKNPILLGVAFSLIVSTNPCTMPYLSIIIANSSQISLFTNLLFFALGILAPSILFTIFGKKMINITNKTKKIGYKVNKIMHYILIISGGYLIFSIRQIEIYDVYIISLFLGFIFIILLKAFFVLHEKKDIFKLKNILILTALGIILFGAFSNCNIYIQNNNNIEDIFGIETNQHSCSSDIENCEVCQKCIYNFSIATILGTIGIFLYSKIGLAFLASVKNNMKNKYLRLTRFMRKDK
ncbi:MAG: hypothetical protein PF569_00830 [Candidatus Woesearchaeota archaeon]|jgi:cytochrome c biogenesis protein CcdA|nr:hypothetical protein [Candidatus Woesearchaeota archaeon]